MIDRKEIERNIITAMVQQPYAIEDCIELGLLPDHFTIRPFAMIYEKIIEQPKIPTKTDQLIKICPMQSETITRLSLATLSTLDLTWQITILRRLHALEYVTTLMTNCVDYRREIDAMTTTEDEIIDRMTAPIMEYLSRCAKTNQNYLFSEHTDQYLRNIESDIESGDMLGIMTGGSKLDETIGGYKPGKLYVIGGRPGHGKTTMICNHACSAKDQEKHVMIVTMEMSEDELRDKMVSSEAKIDYGQLVSRNLDEQNLDRLMEGVRKTHTRFINVLDLVNFSFEDMIKNIRYWHAKGELDIVFIDYLQLLQITSQKFASMRLQVGYMTMTLKRLARELKIPVVVGCQLNRGMTNVPNLAHLKESGAIEQDADVVIFPFKGSDPHSQEKHAPKIIVAKNRQGRTGTINAIYRMEVQRIDEA